MIRKNVLGTEKQGRVHMGFGNDLQMQNSNVERNKEYRIAEKDDLSYINHSSSEKCKLEFLRDMLATSPSHKVTHPSKGTLHFSNWFNNARGNESILPEETKKSPTMGNAELSIGAGFNVNKKGNGFSRLYDGK